MLVGIRNETGSDLFLSVLVREKSVQFLLYSTKPRGIKTTHLPHGADHGVPDRPDGTRTRVVMSATDMTLFAAKKTRRLVHLDKKSRAKGKESYILYTLRLAN